MAPPKKRRVKSQKGHDQSPKRARQDDDDRELSMDEITSRTSPYSSDSDAPSPLAVILERMDELTSSQASMTQSITTLTERIDALNEGLEKARDSDKGQESLKSKLAEVLRSLNASNSEQSRLSAQLSKLLNQDRDKHLSAAPSMSVTDSRPHKVISGSIQQSSSAQSDNYGDL